MQNETNKNSIDCRYSSHCNQCYNLFFCYGLERKENQAFNKESTEARVKELRERWSSFNLTLPIVFLESDETGETLRTRGYEEAWSILWKDAPQEAKDWLTSLPEFDARVFKDITGIEINTEDEVDVTVEGNTVRISRKSAIALGLLKA